MQMLDHPNIIQYHNMVETSSKIYCFMELMTGGVLPSHGVDFQIVCSAGCRSLGK